MRTPVRTLFDNLKHLGDPQALEEMVFELYAPEALFQDPLQKARGRKEIIKMYSDLVKIFPDMSAELVSEINKGDTHVAEWRMTFRSRLWPKAINIDGSTWLDLDHNGLILAHRDYWDLWQFLRRALPIPGALLDRLPEPLRHLLN